MECPVCTVEAQLSAAEQALREIAESHATRKTPAGRIARAYFDSKEQGNG